MKNILSILLLVILAINANASVPICSPKSNYGIVKWYYVMPRSKEIRFELMEGMTEASNSPSHEYSYPIVLTGKNGLELEYNKVMFEANLQMVINAFTTQKYLAVQTGDCLNPSPLPVVTYMVVGNIVP